MKKCFKQYKQVVSAVLVTLMALQPLGSLSAVAATNYDPDYVDAIVDEDAEWESFFAAREATPASPATSSDWAGSFDPTTLNLKVGEEGTAKFEVTVASPSNYDASKVAFVPLTDGIIKVDSTKESSDVFALTITALKEGTADIVARYDGVRIGTSSINVNVAAADEQPEIKSAVFKNPNGEVSGGLGFQEIGGTDTWTLEIPEDATGDIADVKIVPEDENVVTAEILSAQDRTATVKFTAVAVGETNVNAFYNGNIIATLNVFVMDGEEERELGVFVHENGMVTSGVGLVNKDQVSLTFELNAGEGDLANVIFKSEDDKIATVIAANEGKITIEAVAYGTTKVHAYFADNPDKPIATLNVTVDELTLSISPEFLTLEKGQEGTAVLSANIRSIDGWLTAEHVIQNIIDEEYDNIEVKNDGEIDFDFDVDEKGNIVVVAGEKVGTATIVFYYGRVKVSLPITIFEKQEVVNTEGGNTAVNTDNASTEGTEKAAEITDLPEGQTVQQLIEDTHKEADTAKANIAANTAVKEVAPTLNLGVAKPSELNPDIPDIDGVVYPLQSLDKVEMDYEKDETTGTYAPIVKKVVYDISLFWKPVDHAENEEVTGLPLGKVNTGRYTFRIPVPSNIGNNKGYANVKHDNDPVRQYVINKSVADNWFIEVTVTHFSTFELEFTDQRIRTGGGGGGGGGGGSSRSAGSGVANLSGNWILDANQRWWFSLTNGSYPANSWGRINNKWYYFDAAGYMMSGWVQVAGKWYLLQPAGDMVENDWYFYNNNWYYLGADGAMYANQWIQHKDNNWYYLSADGTMAVNTTTPDGYTVNADGVWVQ